MQLIGARTTVYFAFITSILKCLQSEVLLHRYVFFKMMRAFTFSTQVTTSRGIALAVLDAKITKLKLVIKQ